MFRAPNGLYQGPAITRPWLYTAQKTTTPLYIANYVPLDSDLRVIVYDLLRKTHGTANHKNAEANTKLYLGAVYKWSSENVHYRTKMQRWHVRGETLTYLLDKVTIRVLLFPFCHCTICLTYHNTIRHSALLNHLAIRLSALLTKHAIRLSALLTALPLAD